MAVLAVAFSVADAFLLKSLPLEQPEQLVVLGAAAPRGGVYSGEEYAALVARGDSLSSVAASAVGPLVHFPGGTDGNLIRAWQVTPSLFTVLRVRAVHGRVFTDSDTREVAVISYGAWQRLLGGDPAVLDRTIQFGAGPSARIARIVGVMPSEFDYPADVTPQVWVPLGAWMTPPAGSAYLNVIGRLSDDVSLEGAQAQVRGITRTPSRPVGQASDERSSLISFRTALVGDVEIWIQLIALGAALVMLAAVAGVAGLMLSKYARRLPELALRSALGAQPRQLAFDLIAEGVLLSLLATVVGIVLAWWGIGVTRAALPGGMPLASEVSLSMRVFLVAATVGVVAGASVGLMPAWHVARWQSSAPFLAGRTAGDPRGLDRLRSTFVVTTISLVSCLLVVCGFVVLTLLRVLAVDLGFDREGLGAVGTDSIVNVDELTRDLQDSPVVASVAGLVGPLPLLLTVQGGDERLESVRAVGHAAGGGTATASVYRVSAGYFQTLRVEIQDGRPFSEDDAGTPVAIIDDLVAAGIFAGTEGVIGSQLQVGAAVLTVVGIVNTVRTRGPEQRYAPQVYLPLHVGERPSHVIFRATGSWSSAAPQAQAISAASTLAGAIAPPVVSFEHAFATITHSRRSALTILISVGIAMLLVSGAGIAAAIGSFVAHQERHFSIQIALGATRSRILRGVLVRAAAFSCIGLAVGLSAGHAVLRLGIDGLLGGAPDAATVHAVVALMTTFISLAAATLPATSSIARASRTATSAGRL